MPDKGTCEKHGEFDLREGCKECLATPNPDAWRTGEEKQRTEPETVVALMPGEDSQARDYHQQALVLRKYAEDRVIATLEDSKKATDDLSAISGLKKKMADKRKALLDPLKGQADAIRDTYTYLMAPVLEADTITRNKMVAFTVKQNLIMLKQEEINRKRMEAAKAEMELKGELSEPVNLVEVAPEVKRTSTEMGTAGMRDCWKWEVTDFALLPDAYKVVDSAQLSAIAKGHHDKKEVPGVRFYNEPGLSVRAR